MQEWPAHPPVANFLGPICSLFTLQMWRVHHTHKLCRGPLQIVTQETPVRRGTLVEPQVPRDCPADVLKLIHDCTALIAEDRPDTKVGTTPTR